MTFSFWIYFLTSFLTDPPDEELITAFIQYSKEKDGSGLTADEQLARLDEEFGLQIQYVLRTVAHL